jgi:hypothetical protein
MLFMKMPPLATIMLLASLQVLAQKEAWPWMDDGPGTASILLMGDVNIQLRENPEDAFREVMATMRSADFRFMNLEGAFAGASKDPNQPDIPHKTWQHSEPEQVAALTAARIDAVGVANNVTYPWQALMRSLKALDDAYL